MENGRNAQAREEYIAVLEKQKDALDTANAEQAAELERLEKQIRHIKKWCGLNMQGMTAEGITRAVIRMCDDVLPQALKEQADGN